MKRYEDEEVIARVTSDENGIVDFGGIVTYGAGENIYWIKEVDAPSGYLTNIGKMMKVKKKVKHTSNAQAYYELEGAVSEGYKIPFAFLHEWLIKL
jgi:hypothetical protein